MRDGAISCGPLNSSPGRPRTFRVSPSCWPGCTEQFEPLSRIGHSSYRPRWRGDSSGAGQPVTFSEVHAFTRKALDLAIGWPNHDEATLGNLVECLAGMPEEDQSAVWD